MPRSGYRYAGAFLAQAAGIWNVQRQNLAMIEFNLDALIPGGKDVLIRSVQEFTLPSRSIGTAGLPYLNGNSKYLTRPEELGNLSVTFRDFPLVGTRRVLTQWFNLAYNELAGTMLPMSALKITANAVLFDSIGQNERVFLLDGVMPVKDPNEIAINFGSGEILTIPMEFSVDRVIPSPTLLAPASGG